jgi:hypothetical protein
MVAKLLQRVGQRQIFDDAVIGERVTLESFNGKEQTRKPFFNPLPGAPMLLWF